MVASIQSRKIWNTSHEGNLTPPVSVPLSVSPTQALSSIQSSTALFSNAPTSETLVGWGIKYFESDPTASPQVDIITRASGTLEEQQDREGQFDGLTPEKVKKTLDRLRPFVPVDQQPPLPANPQRELTSTETQTDELVSTRGSEEDFVPQGPNCDGVPDLNPAGNLGEFAPVAVAIGAAALIARRFLGVAVLSNPVSAGLLVGWLALDLAIKRVTNDTSSLVA